ncbi:hypothetical protein BB560_001272 [Smittium megazygosporum]|uniref:Tyrosine specific protein phosphatases domain-containing protein n=1 Tax=Smittium megazygosporum TaxID=133381 RepID=A0A2T9ZHZ2_9FUNG|nr:hypothetical protein BB560_001272 [Smittium megazygosporum]
MVAPGIYRSGFPNVKNHKFLTSLGLRKIIYVYKGDCMEQHLQFCNENGIEFLHFKLEANKETFEEMDKAVVAKVLDEILALESLIFERQNSKFFLLSKPQTLNIKMKNNKRNHPILVHCNRGVRRVGCIVGCFRRLQGWVMTAIFDEFQRFSGNKIRISDQEFIEEFSLTAGQQEDSKPGSNGDIFF